MLSKGSDIKSCEGIIHFTLTLHVLLRGKKSKELRKLPSGCLHLVIMLIYQFLRMAHGNRNTSYVEIRCKVIRNGCMLLIVKESMELF